MPVATNGAIRLHYESFGSPRDSALLLINGWGSQLLSFPEAFCDRLVARGLWVTRFDNRDVGLSTHLDGVPARVGAVVRARRAGEAPAPPYTLTDMAEDARAVLDALGAPVAHVVGLSMGGMIAQELALAHPDRVASLTSIMSTTGDPDVGRPREDVRPVLTTPAPPDREGYAAHSVAGRLLYGSPGVQDPDALRAHALAAYDRAHDPEGVARQYAAILAAPSRTARLGGLEVATLVVHGDADGLIDLSGGERTAAAVPGARLVVVEGMGHDLHPAFWDRLVGLIADHAAAAGQPGPPEAPR